MLKKHRLEELKLEKRTLAKLFQFKCRICLRGYGKGFTFHHKEYIEGELSYRDFDVGREYLEYILPQVRSKPKQYALLCRKCHWIIEKNKKFGQEKWNRIDKLVRESNRQGQYTLK